MSALLTQVQSTLANSPRVVKLHSPTKTKADLFSNDFLSLSRSPQLRSAILQRLVDEKGSFLGSTGSRISEGNTALHMSFEAKLREYYNADAVLLFTSGFDANMAVFQALPQDGDVVVYDTLVHISVRDGIRLSRAANSSYSFNHNSAESLKSVLQQIIASYPGIRSGSCTVFVAMESLYSMGGDVAPIQELLDVVENTLPEGCAQIVVDEAHATGLYGPAGRGIVSHMGLDKRVDIRLHTFSKALAGIGGNLIPYTISCAHIAEVYQYSCCDLLPFGSDISCEFRTSLDVYNRHASHVYYRRRGFSEYCEKRHRRPGSNYLPLSYNQLRLSL